MAAEKFVPPPAPPDLATAIGKAMADAIKSTRSDARGLSPEQIERLETPPAPKRHRKVACRSEETGATFTACVVESKNMPGGRIVAFEDYKHPAGVATYQSAGGLVPDGMQILRSGSSAPQGDLSNLQKHDFTPFYLQWRWVEFWQKDIRRYSGKELKAHIAVDPAAFQTPWQEGRVGSLIDDGGS